jgi:hypothetical protein
MDNKFTIIRVQQAKDGLVVHIGPKDSVASTTYIPANVIRK